MDLIEWMSHKKNVEAYLKWKNDPITQAIINGLKAMNTPRRVMDANPNEALQELGFNAGQHSVLNAMMNLEIISTAEEDADISSTKKDYLMEFEGYTEDEADRIIKRMGDIDNG